MLVESATCPDQVEVAIDATTTTATDDQGTAAAVEGVSMRRLRECLTMHNKLFICHMLRCVPATTTAPEVTSLEYHHAEETEECTGVLTLRDGTVVMVSEEEPDDDDLRLRYIAKGPGWVVQCWLRARDLPQYMRIDVDAGVECARRFRTLSVFGCPQEEDDAAMIQCGNRIVESMLANLPRAVAELDLDEEIAL